MSIYHCSIRIIGRSGGRSAVASAAYRSGDRLHNDETGLTHDYTHKGGVIMNEIILSENAPERYLDRETLWNEVQQVEKRVDAQLAREVEVAFPVEMTRVEQLECVRNFIRNNFVSEGMIADWALHDKGDGNPHAHILLTVRGFDEEKAWLQKQKTVFANARDEEGRPVFNPNLPVYDPNDREATLQYRIPQLDAEGKQKTRVREGKGTEMLWEKITIPANDWNDRKKAEIWRASWAEHCNRYLGEEHKIDHRSYLRQGLDLQPTIHEGVTARRIETEGRVSDRCQVNREIRQRNSLMVQIRSIADEITKLIIEKARGLYERFREFGRGNGNNGCTGEDAGHARGAAGRSRRASVGETGTAGAARRISELKRAADASAEETALTDREIAGTDKRIEELKMMISEKKQKRRERMEALAARRKPTEADGGYGTGTNVKHNGTGDHGHGQKEKRQSIRALLREFQDRVDEKREETAGERSEKELKNVKKQKEINEMGL